MIGPTLPFSIPLFRVYIYYHTTTLLVYTLGFRLACRVVRSLRCRWLDSLVVGLCHCWGWALLVLQGALLRRCRGPGGHARARNHSGM